MLDLLPVGRKFEIRAVLLVVAHRAALGVGTRHERLVAVQRAYTHMNNGDLAVEHNDVDGALREYGAAERMFPDNLEMKFWHAVALVNVGRLEQALPMFKVIFAKDKNWATLIPRLPASGTLTADKATIEKILATAPK